MLIWVISIVMSTLSSTSLSCHMQHTEISNKAGSTRTHVLRTLAQIKRGHYLNATFTLQIIVLSVLSYLINAQTHTLHKTTAM
jgi:hypothetical protein